MTRLDSLQAAAAAYASETWGEEDWRQFGRDTGTSDILSGHSRLYRSLGFGDHDYPDAAFEVLGRVLDEASLPGSGARGRMEVLAESMPDLLTWIDANAPNRTKRLFHDYIRGRDASELPAEWAAHYSITDDSREAPEFPELVAARLNTGDAAATQLEAEALAQQVVVDNDGEPEVAADASTTVAHQIFIVHGHDETARDSIRIFVHKVTGVMPISLAEEPGKGATIIEKFERVGSKASIVIVLLTPDDVGQTLAARDAGSAPEGRARQNVVLELGYFIGTIGRDHIIVVDAGVERPSDLAGLSYVSYPGENWKENLRVELEATFMQL